MSGDTLKDRMSRMKVVVGEVRSREESLAVKTEVTSIDLANMKLSFEGLTQDVVEKIGSVIEDVAAFVEELKGSVANLKNELCLQKLALSTMLGINTNAISVNVQVYITSNIMISIQDRLHKD